MVKRLRLFIREIKEIREIREMVSSETLNSLNSLNSLLTFQFSLFTFQFACSAGIIFNTRDINLVIAKNCNRYRADTHKLAMQFCGNLPLLYTFTDTFDCNPQCPKTAVDPHVGA